MKLFVFGITMMLSFSALSCDLVETENTDLIVKSAATEQELGYVSENEDGTWFAWVSGSGAVNENFEDAESASQAVCETESTDD